MNLSAISAGMEARSLAGLSPVQAAAPAAPEDAPARFSVPDRDEYIPEDPSAKTPIGLYRVVPGEDGSPRIRFDDPERKPAETCTINTDRVDRELESLRKKAEELEQRIRAAAPEEAGKLEQEYAWVEQELSQKDNDAYRRRNAVVS